MKLEVPQFRRSVKIEDMTEKQRLKLIADVIKRVGNRLLEQGKVKSILPEMRDSEISEIYALAKGESKYLKNREGNDEGN